MNWKPFAHISKKKLVLAVGDICLVTAVIFVAAVVGVSGTDSLTLRAYVLNTVLFIFTFYLANLYYNIDASDQKNRTFARLLLSTGAAAVLIITLWAVFPSFNFGRRRLGFAASAIVCLVYAWRLTFWLLAKNLVSVTRVLLLGGGPASLTIGSLLSDLPEFEVIGSLMDEGHAETNVAVPALGPTDRLISIVDSHRPGLIVLTKAEANGENLFKHLLQCKLQGIEIYDMPTLYEELTGKVPIQHIRDSWLVYGAMRGTRKSMYAVKIKRVLDILLASTVLIIASPLIILVALCIVAESGFPIFYRQKRVGQDERDFWLVKFRSMRNGAEQHTGPTWAMPNDQRVTKVGRIIRLFRIDELPQLWHVLKGEMSLIGPRPERPEFVAELKMRIPYYFVRHAIKPGLTGWAQVNYRYGASQLDTFEKLQYDLYYLKNVSPLLDLHIILKTVRVVLFRHGSR